MKKQEHTTENTEIAEKKHSLNSVTQIAASKVHTLPSDQSVAPVICKRVMVWDVPGRGLPDTGLATDVTGINGR